MNSEDIINLIEEEYSSCPNMIASDDRLYCYTWYRHDDCERLRLLLYKITNDLKYTLPNIRKDVSKAVEKMMDDPKMQEFLKRLGSDYDKDGKPYWEQ
jgi:hypothetical protein